MIERSCIKILCVLGEGPDEALLEIGGFLPSNPSAAISDTAGVLDKNNIVCAQRRRKRKERMPPDGQSRSGVDSKRWAIFPRLLLLRW